LIFSKQNLLLIGAEMVDLNEHLLGDLLASLENEVIYGYA